MHLTPKLLWSAQAVPSRLALTLALSTAAHTWAILSSAPTLVPEQNQAPFVMQVMLQAGAGATSPAASPSGRSHMARSTRPQVASVPQHNHADKTITPAEYTLPTSSTPAAEIIDHNPVDTASSDNAMASTASVPRSPALIGPSPAPLARFAPAPAYPEEARWERRTGRVVLRFHLRADGSVYDAEIMQSSGHVDIDTAARTALARWRFSQPHVETDVPWFTYAFRFDLT